MWCLCISGQFSYLSVKYSGEKPRLCLGQLSRALKHNSAPRGSSLSFLFLTGGSCTSPGCSCMESCSPPPPPFHCCDERGCGTPRDGPAPAQGQETSAPETFSMLKASPTWRILMPIKSVTRLKLHFYSQNVIWVSPAATAVFVKALNNCF